MSDSNFNNRTGKYKPPKERTRVTGKQRHQWRQGMQHCDEKRYEDSIRVLTDLLEQPIPYQERPLLQGAHSNLAEAYEATHKYALAVTHTALAITYCDANDPFETLLRNNLEQLLTKHPEIPRPRILPKIL